jgi:hypothetical protein
MRKSSYAEVKVVFLPLESGGRANPPILDGKGYRPHVRVPPHEELLGVEFIEGPDEPVEPGVATFASVRLRYYPNVSYADLIVGAEFEIVEGPHVVGHGSVTRRELP